jgi:hypothetical protein
MMRKPSNSRPPAAISSDDVSPRLPARSPRRLIVGACVASQRLQQIDAARQLAALA